MTFTTTAVERMRIDNAGEVMIGSTSSDGIYKLKVVGACYLGAAVTGPTFIAASGAVTAATLTTTGNIVCGGSITGPTSKTTSGALKCTSIACTTIACTGFIGCGSLTSQEPNNFDIVHPTKEGYRLRHRCLEGPLAYLYYPYQYECVVGLNTFDLPDFFLLFCYE